MLILSDNFKKEIKEKAIRFSPEEIGGLIIEVNKQLEIYHCKNMSRLKKDFYIMDCLDYIHASDKGKIVGYFHSHKSKFLSPLDNFNAFSHHLFSVIYSIDDNNFYIIPPELKSYLDLPFKIGTNDCFTLIRNYYKNELKIEINDYYRDKNWYIINPKVIKENFSQEGGIEVKFENIKQNDVIMFGVKEEICHMGIYLDGNYILHQPNGKRSIIEELSEKWKERIITILRHKSLI